LALVNVLPNANAAIRSHLFFKIVSPIFQIGVFAELRSHDFFKWISRLL